MIIFQDSQFLTGSNRAAGSLPTSKIKKKKSIVPVPIKTQPGRRNMHENKHNEETRFQINLVY